MPVPAIDPEVVTLPPMTVAVLRETAPMDALPQFFKRAYVAVGASLASRGIRISGPPMGIYHGMPTETADVSAGYPIEGEIDAPDGVHTETLPGGRAAQLLHVGLYDTLDQSYAKLVSWMTEQGLTPGPLIWETYLTEAPGAGGDPESTQTRITWSLLE